MEIKPPFECEIELEILKDKLAEYQKEHYYEMLDELLGNDYNNTYHEINEIIFDAYKTGKSTIVKYERCIGVSTSLWALSQIFDEVVVISSYNEEEHGYILNDMDLSDKVVIMDDGYRVVGKEMGKVIVVKDEGTSQEKFLCPKDMKKGSFIQACMDLIMEVNTDKSTMAFANICAGECGCLHKVEAIYNNNEEKLTTEEFHEYLKNILSVYDEVSPETIAIMFRTASKEYFEMN